MPDQFSLILFSSLSVPEGTSAETFYPVQKFRLSPAAAYTDVLTCIAESLPAHKSCCSGACGTIEQYFLSDIKEVYNRTVSYGASGAQHQICPVKNSVFIIFVSIQNGHAISGLSDQFRIQIQDSDLTEVI